MDRGMDRTAFVDVGAEIDIPLRGARVVHAFGRDIAILRTGDGTIFAIEDSCPHKGGRLSHGIVHGHAVTCPLHNWVIGLESGMALAPDEGCVARFAVLREEGRILLDLAGPVT